ncbi:MAG: amidohydrolase family protein [bacterium]|jgi:imidazolonepropionase-like amidohydrolase
MQKVIKCGYLLDCNGSEPIKDGVILIEGERIAAAGKLGDFAVPSGAEVIDLGGAYVMPGMIDCHLHVGMNGMPSFEMSLVKELVPTHALKGMLYAQKDLNAGFTSLRDVGELGYIDIAIKKAINDSLYQGPRMQVAGKVLSTTGGHGDTHFVPEVDFEGLGIVVDSPDAARKAARENLKHGADLVKISATGGVMSDGDEPGAQQLTFEEMKAALDEAKKVGKGSAAHAQGTKGIKDAIRAGVRSIDHGFWLDDEACEMMLVNDTFMVPTLVAVYGIVENGVAAGIPDYAVRKAKAAQADHLESFRLAMRKGVKIAMGTDAGTPFNYHGKNAFELELMVRAGMPAEQAVLTTTKLAAELMGWEDHVGSIAPGKYADIIAVPGNPLADIKVLQDVRFVMKGGAVIR